MLIYEFENSNVQQHKIFLHEKEFERENNKHHIFLQKMLMFYRANWYLNKENLSIRKVFYLSRNICILLSKSSTCKLVIPSTYSNIYHNVSQHKSATRIVKTWAKDYIITKKLTLKKKYYLVQHIISLMGNFLTLNTKAKIIHPK